jgi:hypothetical protein
MLEETVMMNLLTMQVTCFYEVLSGNPENMEHMYECRKFLERYIGQYEGRFQVSSMQMISMGIQFLGRNWRSIVKLARELMNHDNGTVPADLARQILNECPVQHSLWPMHVAMAAEDRALAS